MEHNSLPEQFTNAEVLEALRELIQEEIDPRTGDGRGFDAELGKAELLRDGFGIDTPDKAIELLQEAIKKRYDPFDNLDPWKSRDAGWPTHLSGLLEGRGLGSVFEGDDEYDIDLWIDRVRTAAYNEEAPGFIPLLKRREFADSPQDFWVNRINELTVRSIKLASKRTLHIDQEYKPQDDDSLHGMGERQDIADPGTVQKSRRLRRLGVLAFRKHSE